VVSDMQKKYQQQILQMKRRVATRKGKLPVVLFILFFSVMTVSSVNAAGTNTLTVAATIISKNVCKFKSGATTLNFGALDPGGTTDVSKSATMQFICNGSSSVAAFVFTSNDGLYETGPGANRMINTTVSTEYLPYTLALSPQSGTVPKGVTQTLTVTGTVASPNYRSAYVGNYSDTVVISLNP
jgi:hypothetical protein